ncbi:MAG: hypothetical protein ACOX88_08240 [Christensenellales bacterium]|jgi:putative ABC transport system permease protein
MNAIKRAWLHITRKKGKSVLLLFIMILISTLLFSSVLIYSGTQTALKDIKQQLQSSFTLDVDYSTESSERIWITEELVQKILNVEGIYEHNRLL